MQPANPISVIERLTRALSSLPQVLAVVLADPHEAGIELQVYSVREVPLDFQGMLLRDSTETGVRVNIVYRSPERLEDVLDGIIAHNEAAPDDAARLLNDVVESQALFDPRGRYRELQNRCRLDARMTKDKPLPAAARIEHAAAWVSDLDRACDFYRRWFGATVGPQYSSATRPFTSRFLELGSGARLELMSAPKEPPRIAHIAISLGSRAAVDDLVSAMSAAGVPLAGGPRVTGDGYYEAVVMDADGNLVEITA